MQVESFLPKELYHYTSWKTFEKIVKNRTWRFSSINDTNDLSENLNLYLKQLLSDKDLISNIDYNCIDKQSTPPEIYLLSIDNIDLLDDILLGTIKTSFDISKESTIFYKEKWNHGYDRYLWIIPNDYIRKREKI